MQYIATGQTKKAVFFDDRLLSFIFCLSVEGSSAVHCPSFTHISANLQMGKEVTLGPFIEMDGRLLDLREKCVERVNKYLKITAVFNSITDRKFYVQTASDGQARVVLSHRDVWLVLFCFCYYYFLLYVATCCT